MPLRDPLSLIVESLRNEQFIPDVIPEDFVPSILFYVKWDEKEAMLGTELTVDDTQGQPSVSIMPMGAEEGNPTFTLAMLDPDAPSRNDPKYGPFRHWVIAGLRPPSPGEVVAAASVGTDLLSPAPDPLAASSDRKAFTPYRPPGPGPGTGRHRYVFLLFQEREPGYTLPADAPEYGSELEARRNWSPTEFAKNSPLTLVGANYFTINAA